MAKTKIEWTDAVWNPVTGCSKISPGCQNCYAERMAKRLAGRCGYPKDEPFRVTLHPERLEEQLKWKKPRRVFVCSMGDLFHEDVPEKFIYDVWDVMVKCSQHTFLLLTKRPERMKTFVSKVMANRKEYAETLKDKETRLKVINWAEKPVKNIWLGVTAENQEMADKRIPILLQIPAVVRFVSCEPLLGPVDLELYLPYDHSKYKEEWHRNGYHVLRLDKGITEGTLDWVVCGGESGPGARPMHPDWVRSLRNQCQVAGVPFLFKQQGEWSWDNTGSDIVGFIAPDGTWKPSQPLGWGADYPGSVSIWKVGKKKAGRLLDGRIWEEYPEVVK